MIAGVALALVAQPLSCNAVTASGGSLRFSAEPTTDGLRVSPAAGQGWPSGTVSAVQAEGVGASLFTIGGYTMPGGSYILGFGKPVSDQGGWQAVIVFTADKGRQGLPAAYGSCQPAKVSAVSHASAETPGSFEASSNDNNCTLLQSNGTVSRFHMVTGREMTEVSFEPLNSRLWPNTTKVHSSGLKPTKSGWMSLFGTADDQEKPYGLRTFQADPKGLVGVDLLWLSHVGGTSPDPAFAICRHEHMVARRVLVARVPVR